MPENEIKIKVTVADKEQLDALWQKFEQGKATLADVTRLKKDMNAAFKGEIIGTDDYNKFAGQLAKINDLQRDVRIQTRAGHEAYFKAGLEVRQLALSSGLLKGALGGVTSELANSVLNAVQLKQALVPLGISMTGVGLGIAAAVAVLPALVSLLSQTEQRAKSAKESMSAFKEEMTSFFEGVDPEEIARVSKLTEADLGVAKAELVIAKEKQKTLQATTLLTGGLTSAQLRAADQIVNSLNRQIERYNTTLQIQRDAIDIADRRVRSELQSGETLKKRIILEHEFNDILFKRLKAEEIFELQQQSRALKQPIGLKGKLARVPGVSDKSFADSLPEAIKNLTLLEHTGMALVDSLEAGIGSVTQAIGQGMGNAFRKAFGEANSLLEIFAQSMLSMFAELMARTAILTALKAIGGPFSILFPMGAGGGGGSSPISNVGQNAAMSRAGGSRGGGGFGDLQLRTEIAGSKLAVIVESGNRMNSRGRIS